MTEATYKIGDKVAAITEAGWDPEYIEGTISAVRRDIDGGLVYDVETPEAVYVSVLPEELGRLT